MRILILRNILQKYSDHNLVIIVTIFYKYPLTLMIFTEDNFNHIKLRFNIDKNCLHQENSETTVPTCILKIIIRQQPPPKIIVKQKTFLVILRGHSSIMRYNLAPLQTPTPPLHIVQNHILTYPPSPRTLSHSTSKDIVRKSLNNILVM